MKFSLLARSSALVLASGLGIAGMVYAQEGPRAGGPAPHHRGPAHHAQHDHGMRLQDLKAKLKLTPAQESAWAAFEASMKPVSASAEHPKMEALAKMNAVERMQERQKMHEAMQKQHALRMNEQLDATKTLYAALSSEQQATFDKETLPHHVMRMSNKKKEGAHEGKKGKPGQAPEVGIAQPAAPKS